MSDDRKMARELGFASLRDRGAPAVPEGRASKHSPTCRREITRHADDSAAYLSETCTCGAVDASPRSATPRFESQEDFDEAHAEARYDPITASPETERRIQQGREDAMVRSVPEVDQHRGMVAPRSATQPPALWDPCVKCSKPKYEHGDFGFRDHEFVSSLAPEEGSVDELLGALDALYKYASDDGCPNADQHRFARPNRAKLVIETWLTARSATQPPESALEALADELMKLANDYDHSHTIPKGRFGTDAGNAYREASSMVTALAVRLANATQPPAPDSDGTDDYPPEVVAELRAEFVKWCADREIPEAVIALLLPDAQDREKRNELRALVPSAAPQERATEPLNDKQRGLYRKFNVERTDGSSVRGGKHHGCEYFVLDMTHDAFARPAIRAYIEACIKDYPLLAIDLKAKYIPDEGEGAPPTPMALDGVSERTQEREGSSALLEKLTRYVLRQIVVDPKSANWKAKLLPVDDVALRHRDDEEWVKYEDVRTALQSVLSEGERREQELRAALEESVKLQSHYADLLNMHDGGQRMGFAGADQWLARLRELRVERRFPTQAEFEEAHAAALRASSSAAPQQTEKSK